VFSGKVLHFGFSFSLSLSLFRRHGFGFYFLFFVSDCSRRWILCVIKVVICLFGEKVKENQQQVSGRPIFRTREGGRREERERREPFFYFIKIMGWEATVLPNELGITVASQQKNSILGYLLEVSFWCFFYDIFPKHREGNHFREYDGSALRS
jgi:hypothetical protein